MELVADPNRLDMPETGIKIRATLDSKWGAHDITHLTKESLLEWLKSRDSDGPDAGKNWREQVILLCFGHD